jgi:hypothetical protein
MCKEGEIYISKKVDVYDLLDNGDDEKLMEFVEEGEVLHYTLDMFRGCFIKDIENDLKMFKEIAQYWEEIIEDPKKEQFLKELETNPKLINRKLLYLLSQKKTAEYVGDYLNVHYPERVISYSGQSSLGLKQEIEQITIQTIYMIKR